MKLSFLDVAAKVEILKVKADLLKLIIETEIANKTAISLDQAVKETNDLLLKLLEGL